jgi:hypothetical protein
MSNVAEDASKNTYTTATGQQYKYQTVTLSISNATPGMPITVSIAGKNGQVVMWSSGNPVNSGSSGMNMQVLTGTLPLTGFQLTASQVNFLTAAGGGSAVAFNFNAFLCAGMDVSEFYVTLSSASTNTQASLQLQGQTPQNLTLNKQVPFDWGNSQSA